MDTPDPTAPVPGDPASHPTTPPPGHAPTADVGVPTPPTPIALGPVAGGWSPPLPPLPPTPPTTPEGGGTWGPWSTPYGLAWGPTPIPPVSVPRRHPRLLPLIGLAVVVSMLVGVGLGYAVWRPATRPAANALNNGSSGSGSLPSGGSPFGSGQGSTTTPSGSGTTGSSNSSSVAAKVDPGLVDVNVTLSYQNESAAGTGQVLTSSGLVLTNNHVIDGATSISATDIGNGQTYTASVVGYDRTGDLALIQLHGASGLNTVTIGDSSKVTVGESIVAIGNAGGVGGTPSVATGTVTTLNQQITASDDDGANAEQLTGLIEVDANIQPGDSGGPLVNSAGDVIGIDTAASSSYSLSSAGGDGYAIPINQAIGIVKQIEAGKSSSVVHIGPTAFLGVVVEPAGGTGGSGLFGGGGSGSSESGAMIEEIAPSSPAEQAGLSDGDVITSAGGQTVSSPQSLSTIISTHTPGQSMQIVWTDTAGNQHTATVQLASGPAT